MNKTSNTNYQKELETREKFTAIVGHLLGYQTKQLHLAILQN